MSNGLYVFFFCKQKTAYEMRISDWSPDVCSSELRHGRHRQDDPRPRRRPRPGDRVEPLRQGRRVSTGRAGRQGRARVPAGHARREARPLDDRDRKSVASGKSVSVRVDLGGRRIIKKKKRDRREEHTSERKKVTRTIARQERYK